MTPLTARDIQNARASGKAKQLDQPTDIATIAREIEDRLILEQILGVEVRLPPIDFPGSLLPGRRSQKKTGSRYAPNTFSIAARIS